MNSKISEGQIHIYLTKIQRARAVRRAGMLGEKLTSMVRLALSEFLDREDEKEAILKQRRRDLLKTSFVPTVEDEWSPAPKKSKRTLAKDPLHGIPVPATIPVLGDALIEDDE